MHNQKHMSAVFTAVRLSLKNVGAVRFVPLVLFDVLYPLLLCSMHFNGTEPDMIEVYLLQMSQVIFPFFCSGSITNPRATRCCSSTKG